MNVIRKLDSLFNYIMQGAPHKLNQNKTHTKLLFKTTNNMNFEKLIVHLVKLFGWRLFETKTTKN